MAWHANWIRSAKFEGFFVLFSPLEIFLSPAVVRVLLSFVLRTSILSIGLLKGFFVQM